jgi:hypothetical protein
MHQSRRRSSARPRMRTTATTSTSWLNRWEAEQDAREAELARAHLSDDPARGRGQTSSRTDRG